MPSNVFPTFHLNIRNHRNYDNLIHYISLVKHQFLLLLYLKHGLQRILEKSLNYLNITRFITLERTDWSISVYL